MYIVARESEITAQSLNRLFELAGADLPPVESVRAEALDGGYGYLSLAFRLHVKWSGTGASGAPPTLIAKLPLQARLDAMTPDAVRMFRREAMFHRIVAPTAPIRTAKAWVTEIDESGAATLIFEDLNRYETFEDNETVAMERVEDALSQLAALHARYWQSPELESMDWLAFPAETGVDQVSAARFARYWPELVRSSAYELSPAQLRLGELLSEKLDGVYEALHAGPMSLIHTDLHQENLFFDGNETTFIDWAAAERANPAKDIAKLTASCLEPGTVGQEQPRLIRHYWDALMQQAPLSLDGRGIKGEGDVGQRPTAQRPSTSSGRREHAVPTEGYPLCGSQGSDRGSMVEREIPNQVQHDKQRHPISVTAADLERYTLLATCHYLGMMTFLSGEPDFDSLTANPETRTDFTTSRVIAACDREDLVAAVEAV